VSKVKLTSTLGFLCNQMSQLLRLVTQMYDNERTYDKEKCGRQNVMLRTQIRRILSRRLAVDICARILCMSTYYIFSTYDSISTWYNVDDTKAAFTPDLREKKCWTLIMMNEHKPK